MKYDNNFENAMHIEKWNDYVGEWFILGDEVHSIIDAETVMHRNTEEYGEGRYRLVHTMIKNYF